MPGSSIVHLDQVDVDIDGRAVLHGISLGIGRAGPLGIVGGNGSGKSTLLALIAGLRWPAPGRGTRVYDFGAGPETDAITARRRITRMGHELQDLYFARGWNFRVRDIVLSGMTRTDIPQRNPSPALVTGTAALLDRTDLAHLGDRRLLALSRGEQRRVLIARALAMSPSLLLLDEPASGLDTRARDALETLLSSIAATTPLVIAAHRPDELPAVVSAMAAIDGGRLAEPTPATASPRASSMTRSATPTLSETAPRSESAPRSETTRPRAAPSTGSPAADSTATPLIVLEGVDAWLDGRRVLDSIDWTIRNGEHWLVTGPNGAGKSTLLRLLNAEIRPARGGTIGWPGLGDPTDVWALRRRVALVSAELQARYRYPTTVADAIGSGFSASIGRIRPLSPEERARVGELLTSFELEALADRQLGTLSYGQRHRVLIARTLASRPRVLLLDEPWEGLDPGNADIVRRVLTDSTRAGTQLVCVSHVGAGGLPLNRQLRLEGGRILSAGGSVAPRENSASARYRATDCRQD